LSEVGEAREGVGNEVRLLCGVWVEGEGYRQLGAAFAYLPPCLCMIYNVSYVNKLNKATV
jgi:hypothetical protein